MLSISRFILTAALGLCGVVPALAQTPRAYFKFDGNTADSSSAGIVTAVTPDAGFTPTYNTDRFGVAGKAIDFLPGGSHSLQLVAAAMVGNSNEALGLRSAGGNNSFTLAGWAYSTAVFPNGYSTMFGNLGTGAGTLHAGLGNGSNRAHFGFDGNDANGITTTVLANQWFHYAYVYDAVAQTQRIYINGVPEIVRTGVTNTLKAADLYLGNWETVNHATNDLKGRLDDVVVYAAALDAGQVQALFNDVDPNALPAPGTYSAPKLPGYYSNAEAKWNVREIKAYPVLSYSSLVNADRIIRAYASTPGGTVAEYQTPVINMADPDNGASHYFPDDLNFGTGVAGIDDQNFLVLAKCAVRITVEDEYTFGFRGNEGARLRVLGKQFLSSTRLGLTANLDPAHDGDGLYFINPTTDSNTLGVVHLTPGDYNLELTYWEGTGPASVEVFAARGAKAANDGTFRLIGDTAGGGLEVVRDPDTWPQVQVFTANGSSTSLYLHNPLPPTITLAWQANALTTSLSIDQGIGSVAVPTSSMSLATPASGTIYTITASNGTDSATKSVTVLLNTPPSITSFTTSSNSVTTGSNATLNWVANGAVTLTLNPGNIDVTGQTSRVVTVPAGSTTYTLSATNPSGMVQQSMIILAGTLPVINSFTIGDANPLYGAETFVSWNVSAFGATTISINQGIGTVATTGTAAILPYQTTTYTLSATNSYGTVTAAVTANEPTPIGVAAPGFTVRRVNSTVAFPFTPLGYLDSALAVLAGTNAGTQTSGTYTTVNFTDGAEGDFTSGNVGFPGGSGDNFAVQITGTLIVNTPGQYTFVVSSDDGARLRVDGQDVIVDDGTHSPSSNSGKVTLTKPTAQIELIYYDVTGGAEVELGWIRPNLTWQLLSTTTPAAPVVQGKVLLSEFVGDNKSSLLDEDGASSDWLEIWNSTNATVTLAGYYLTNDPAIPNKWAFPAWTLDANKYLVAFASSKDRRPAQVVAGQDNPGTLAQPHLHTSFNINKNTGYLALTKDNGAGGFTVVTAFENYPPQNQDVSYGSSDAEGYIGYMETPTPGLPNAATVQGFVGKVSLDHPRGRYSAPFNLAITSSTPGAIIRYTTDGSPPTRNTGTIYSGPLAVSGTKVIRAFAYKIGWKASDIETQSYLFIDDIATQTTATATALGFPTGSISPRSQVLRYGMTLGNVTAGGGNLQSLKNALAAAPTISMTTAIPNLMDASTGIYANADRHGLFWERPVSIEYINQAGTSEFQINCGARIRGGYSRSAGNPKHAFHLYFRGSLYDGNLKYPLFGTSGASDFNQIDMRCEENYSWSFGNDPQNSLMREEWSRVTEGDMGQPYARNGYFHLYINGIYWGVYNWEERTEAAFGATYLGGLKDNFDTVKSAGSSGGYDTEMTDGNFAAWQDLYKQAIALKNDTGAESNRTGRYMKMRGLNPNGTPNASYKVLLDVDNLIDYMLVTFFDGSFDAPLSTFLNNASNNWFGVRDRLGSRGFAFFAHDNEHGMDSVSDGRAYNRVGPWGGSGTNNWKQGEYNTRETLLNTFYSKSNPQYLHEMLAYSAEYRQRFADRVQRHFFNGGALTTGTLSPPAGALGRVATLASQVDPIIHAEAARWGSGSLNKTSWLSAKNTIINFMNNGGAIPSGHPAMTPGNRTALLLQFFRAYTDVGAKPLFPAATLAAPTFSGQFGGLIASPYNFTISNPNGTGTIYYTLDGTDPRGIDGVLTAGALTGASPLPVTLNNTSTVRARIYVSTTQWSPLVEASYLVGSLASSANLVISKIHYHPISNEQEEFIEVMNVSAVSVDLTGCAFTLGVEFHFPPGYTLDHGARALVVRDTTAFKNAHPAVPVGIIVPGVFENSSNLSNSGERIQLLDASGGVIRDFTYSDIFPWPTAPDGVGPCLVLLRPTSIPIPDHGLASNWRASVANGGSPGVSDAVSFANWTTTSGVTGGQAGDDDGDGTSNFAEYFHGTLALDPASTGRPILAVQSVSVGGIVANYLTLTFIRRLGRDDAIFSVQAASDLTSPTWAAAVLVGTPLSDGNGTETLTYRYPDPMPNPPTGGTKQFLRLKVTQVVEPLSFTSWAASSGVTGGQAGDDDGDGTSNLAEYFHGTLALNPTSTGRPILAVQSVSVGGIVSNYLTLTFTRYLGRDDATFLVQATTDLTSPIWAAALPVGSPLNNGDGTEILTYRYPDPIPNPPVAGTKQFLRLKIVKVP